MRPPAPRRLAGAALTTAIFAAAVFGPPAMAQAPGLGAGVELVDPDALRICADPSNLPFSDEKGDGFENKIARLLGEKLGKPVTYTYFPQIIGFVRNTLNAYRCDLIIGVAVGDDVVQTTNPYYHTSYALLVKKGSDLDGITSLDDPRLKDKRVGVVAGTPPATAMVRDGLMDRAKPYPLTIDTRAEAPAKSMVDDLQSGQIDAAVLWGPIAGYWAVHQRLPLTLTPLASGNGVRMDFSIAMGVRHSDQAWKRQLNTLISANKGAIDQILTEYGVPLIGEQGKPLAAQ
jgi:quinoprotein dehydrogenase-associated probable ABC transporter substrate-binding protein